MRLSINESDEYEDIEIIIQCPKIDDHVSQLIEHIQQHDIHLIGKSEDLLQSIPIKNLLYIESVDNNSFLYTQTNVFESNLKLYEIEKVVQDTRFIRISKNLIVNTSQIQSVRALFNGRFEALLKNNEKVIVNRHYVKSFKEKFLN